MADERTTLPNVPQSRGFSRKRTRLSVVWIIPIVAAAIGVWVAVTRILSQGPEITITFASAEGLEAGKTKISYKGVDVGTITKIRLSEDHMRVIANAQMAPKTEDFLTDDTRFWVVRPRISGATISGLGTLISGSYIGMEIGNSKQSKREFIALETPPVVSEGVPGRFFVLKTSSLGSLDIGTPLFFRHLQVGQIASYRLDKSGRNFTIRVFVKAPYDQYVNPNTRFWQASGIDLQLSASGLTVRTESLLSILIGGVAFETPVDSEVLSPADAETVFTLYSSRAEAYEPPPQHPQTYQVIFKESVRGLLPGAPVELRGIKIGQVTDVRAQIDFKTAQFSVPVTIELDPMRLGVQVIGQAPPAELEAARRRVIDSLVARGVRAQLRTGNLLTGAALVAFDFFPSAKPVSVDWSQKPVQLPTIPGDLQTTERKIEAIVDKVDQMPFTEIGNELKNALGQLNLTLVSARGTLTTADSMISPDSAQGQELSNTLIEINRMARSLRVLADYLEQHPEALIRGKPGEPK
jgi:paraquat-inducible protein B